MARLTSAVRGLLVVAALAATGTAMAQRVSLGDRVSALERQSATQNSSAGQANVELLNRLTQMQSEVQALRNQLEQLQNENAQLRDSNQNRYKDLDDRLQRIEAGTTSSAGVAPSAVGGRTGPTSPSSGGLVSRVPRSPMTAPPMSAPPMSAPPIGDPGDERAAYDSAFAALRAGDYVASARGFQAYVNAFPQGALAPNAWYWLGESYYVTQNYPIALQSFNTLLQQFPGSTKAPDALLKRGFSQIEMGQAGPGQATLNRVINDFPGSDAARLAAGKLRTLQLQSR